MQAKSAADKHSYSKSDYLAKRSREAELRDSESWYMFSIGISNQQNTRTSLSS